MKRALEVNFSLRRFPTAASLAWSVYWFLLAVYGWAAKDCRPPVCNYDLWFVLGWTLHALTIPAAVLLFWVFWRRHSLATKLVGSIAFWVVWVLYSLLILFFVLGPFFLSQADFSPTQSILINALSLVVGMIGFWIVCRAIEKHMAQRELH